MSRVDTHFHIRARKSFKLEYLKCMAEAAVRHKLDGIVLLDHDYHPTDDDVRLFHEAAPGIKVFKGVEFSVKDEGRKIKDHVVVVCDAPYDWDISHGVTTRDLPKLANYVRMNDALVILAHPFRKHPNIAFDFYDLMPDAVEIASPSTGPEKSDAIRLLATRFRLSTVAASDSHKEKHVGKFCIDIVSEGCLESLKKLKREIKCGRYMEMG